jgi:lipopolysaccharide export system permease protein
MIIFRYLTKEVFQSLFAVTFVLLLIFLSNQLVRYLSYAASGKIPASILLQLMGLEIPYLLAVLLPLGLYLGILLTYGRLYADNELRVMQAYGLSTQKLMIITGSFAIFMMIVVSALTFFVNPLIASQKDKLIAKGISTQNLFDSLIPGRFQLSGDDKRVIYVEKVARNHKEAQNIFVAEQKTAPSDALPESTSWAVLSAASGYQTRNPLNHDRFVVATEGYRYEGVPGQLDYKIIQFKKYAIRIPAQEFRSQRQLEEAIPTLTLWSNDHDPKNAAELQWRISLPLSLLLLAILAVPMSYIRPRQSRYAQVLSAILIYVIYMNLLFVARDWVEHDYIPGHFGMGWVHILFLGFVVILIFIQTKMWRVIRPSSMKLKGYR